VALTTGPEVEAGPSAITSVAPAQRAEAERRQLSVLFCDLVGSTALTARLDPEDMGEVIRRYQEHCTEVVSRWDGHVAKYMGDGVLAYFGWPRAHEDDAERAVHAGLDLAQEVGRLTATDGTSLGARIGIATGLVMVGDLVGGGAAREQSVVGETPNLAARLQSLAEPGTVVIPAGTRHLVGGLFEYADLGAQDLKGFANPVRVWRVVGETRTESRFEALHGQQLTALVGREHEIGLLADRWERAKEGEGQVVLLSGEPGIGKSRMVRALRERLAGEPHTPLSHYCSPYHTNSALFPVIGLLERAAAFSRDDRPDAKLGKLEALLARGTEALGEAVPLVAALLGIETGERYQAPALSPQRQKQRTLEVLLDQVEGLAAREPVLAIYEDVHWMDPTTLEALGMLTERIRDLRVLVLISFRPEFDPPWTGHAHVMRLSLSRLTRGHGQAMVAAVTGGKALPEEVVDQILAKTDGVPLFVEELTKTVLETRLLDDAGDHYELSGPLPSLAIPATLHDSLMARLDRLAPVKEVAQIGAAIGREFGHGLLAAVSRMPDDQLNVALNQLVASELIFRRGTSREATYSFKHALVQEAAYQSLLRTRRQQLHAVIATAIVEKFPEIVENQPEIVARHYTEAKLTADAIHYWVKAGYRAKARFANVEAVSHLNKALQLLMLQPESPERDQQELEIHTALGVPLIATKGYAAAETGEAHSRALELSGRTGDESSIFPILYGLWIFHLQHAELNKARRMAEQYLDRANKEVDTVGILVGHRILGVTLFCLNELKLAYAHLSKAASVYDPAEHSSLAYTYAQDPYAAAQSLLAAIHWSLGYTEQASKAMFEATACAERLQHPQSLVYALFYGSWHYVFSDPPTAVEQAGRCLEISEEQQMPFFAGMSKVLRGWALAVLGQPCSGIKEILEGTEKARGTGDILHRSMQLTALAAACLRSNQSEDGLSAADEAIVATREGAILWFSPEISRLKGELLLGQPGSGHDEAEACFRDALSLACTHNAKSWELRAATSLARLWVEQGKRQAAHDLLAPIYGSFTEGFATADLKKAKALLNELG
jgi:class 3 adenylate cyclase/predicted ATPase